MDDELNTEAVRNMERFDNFAGLRHALAMLGSEREHWAGIPMPLEGMPLVVHPRYPLATELMALGRKSEPGDDEIEAQYKIRNQFWCTRYRSMVVVFEHDGKIGHGILPGANHATQLLLTLGASDAWGIAQEARALQLLGTLVKHHTFKHYLLTGMFLESSERSGLTYVFRKLRPTLALRERNGRMIVLAALCGHPIAHYSGSWAGAMCPTDDVIAALMLMRGDEHMFWRRSNQHHPSRPEAGI